MLCHGTRIIYHTANGNYEFTIIHALPQASHQTSPSSKSLTKRRVTFYEKETIHLIPSKDEEDRSIGFEIPRGLIGKCKDTQNTLTTLLNTSLTNKICPSEEPLEEGETSLKIMSSQQDKGWWEDCSPIELLNDLSSGKHNLFTLASKIDSLIESTLDFNMRAPVQLQYYDYIIDIRKAQKIVCDG